jgi:protein-disulfide isomerase
LAHIRELRQTKARAAYINQLRANTSARVLLAPPSAEVDIEKAYIRGPKDAPVVLVEFADYECPYCEKVNPVLQKLQSEYGNKLAVVYKDIPLSMHRRAQKAAEAARCAGDQGKFWEFHDVLFYSKQLDIESLKEHARVLKLDEPRFQKCLDEGQQAAAVKKDADEGRRLGLTGTPSFFVNGHFLSGAVEYNTLKEMVEQQLAVASKTSSSQRQVSQK